MQHIVFEVNVDICNISLFMLRCDALRDKITLLCSAKAMSKGEELSRHGTEVKTG